MGFKADTSFLRFLSMGAASARQTVRQMQNAGFEPIELERYCTSNKIWQTKVKRLRLPDILCVRTGLRVEVRAKTDLKIRMSDAPTNPDRRWHTGLRDDDLSAFIACFDHNGSPEPADEAVFFTIGDLKATEPLSELGIPKSASEGAERDRTWSCIVPSRSGVVQTVDDLTMRVLMDAHQQNPQRTQTYQLRGKVPYAKAGERFVGKASILAGLPPRQVKLDAFRDRKYDPLASIDAMDPVDRYAAIKSLPFRRDLRLEIEAAVAQRLDVEGDDRVLLEAAGVGTILGLRKARERLQDILWNHDRADLRMEAVLILIESKSDEARDILLRVATDPRFKEDEVRQAAVWGLGKAGVRKYADLIPFLDDSDPDVVLHAIVAFDADAPIEAIDFLVRELIEGRQRRAPAASEALTRIGSELALSRIVAAARASAVPSDWLLATLGRFPDAKVRELLVGDPLLDRVSPILLLSS